MKTNAVTLLASVLIIAGSAHAAAAAEAAASGDAALMALADQYFDQFYFPANPSSATADGIHRYDDKLEDFSRAEVQRQAKALHDYERRFEATDPKALSERVRGDRELLLSSIRSTLLTLETLRPWQLNPDSYSSGITASAFTLMERNFASPNERLRLLIARERQMPTALAAARTNLSNPPQIYTEIALEQLPGIISFFRHDLPTAFTAADDAALKAQFGTSNGRVIEALERYQSWLKQDLLPRSHGEFRLGAKNFRAKLLYDEMVDYSARATARDRHGGPAAQSGGICAGRQAARARQERAAGAR